ncbi:hypothetical protein Sste5346_001852 [Sporothrix stenoceras]|uniref:C2H2-type domain-containing protein n=1 Tax=Sporothrix stenoceras TaxID=5173 RepID=A0ABR3ZMF8_9PEZI
MGSASLSSLTYPQQSALQTRPSRMRQFGMASSSSASNNSNNDNNSSAMDIDELANTEEDDEEESDVPPLVMSDLDPRYAKKVATPKKSPSQASPSTQPTHAPSLTIRQQPQTPHKSSSTNGTAKKLTTTPLRQPVVSIPLTASASSTHQTQPHTPGKMTPMTVSVSLPSLYTPKAASSRGDNSMTPRPAGTAALPPPPSATKTKSPVVAVGRRSNTGSLNVQPVKGRPKGWKPGMTYREVALRNAGVDPNDPNVPREILVPPRPKKTGRPPGRPRLPGGPRPKPSSQQAGAFGYKRVGRPPIQPIEAVQRSIFCSEQACFAPFLCEWTGCRAELQNMATLRKHVAVVHGRPTGAAKTCQWRQCASKREPSVLYMGDTDTDYDGRTFMEHVEYQHLTPLEWHRGDGFVNNGHIGPPAPPAAAVLLTKARTRDAIKAKTEGDSKVVGLPAAAPPPDTGPSHWAPEVGLDGIPTEDLPRYLLDDNGKQVTPLLRDGLLESSTIFWTQEERGRRLKELYRQHQQNMNKRPERGLGRLV